ncbi:hypothetical protein C7C46_32490 [Streptomyces tateyamensis]|uniref:Uncharacterized protein n=1 Tax=Streptomyces tateyamensis TaxID=565073 RepID=A0A2V4NGW1_9ACTN|nr:hypothetical protein [Streptomyces tateyamensis]PYC65574.1 hypothetical protein C7C46_32490 [Streptomyces tateyamensis]
MRTTVTYARSLARTAARRLAARLADGYARAKAEPDAGYTTETIVITALLVLCGIAALGVLTTKVLDKVNGLNF